MMYFIVVNRSRHFRARCNEGEVAKFACKREQQESPNAPRSEGDKSTGKGAIKETCGLFSDPLAEVVAEIPHRCARRNKFSRVAYNFKRAAPDSRKQDKYHPSHAAGAEGKARRRDGRGRGLFTRFNPKVLFATRISSS